MSSNSSSSSLSSSSAAAISCRLCRRPIKFDNKHVSNRTGKKIPLDIDTEQPHDCPVFKGSQQYQQQPQSQQQSPQQPRQDNKQRQYLQCSKGCGGEIYFDVNTKTQSGKWIPISRATGLPHQCQ